MNLYDDNPLKYTESVSTLYSSYLLGMENQLIRCGSKKGKPLKIWFIVGSDVFLMKTQKKILGFFKSRIG